VQRPGALLDDPRERLGVARRHAAEVAVPGDGGVPRGEPRARRKEHLAENAAARLRSHTAKGPMGDIPVMGRVIVSLRVFPDIETLG